MQLLQRITTSYDAREDRIRLTGSTGDGALTVWLTRRLLVLLMPVLVRHLEPATAAQGDAYGALRQEFAQQAARDAIAPEVPVVAAGDSAELLPEGVDVTPHEGGLVLRFRADGDAVAFTLAGTVLRQWLHLLWQADQAGGWDLPGWPQWLAQAANPVGMPGAIVH